MAAVPKPSWILCRRQSFRVAPSQTGPETDSETSFQTHGRAGWLGGLRAQTIQNVRRPMRSTPLAHGSEVSHADSSPIVPARTGKQTAQFRSARSIRWWSSRDHSGPLRQGVLRLSTRHANKLYTDRKVVSRRVWEVSAARHAPTTRILRRVARQGFRCAALEKNAP